MECRICKQPISFIKGTRSGQKRKVTVAVHDNEVSQAINEMQGEVVTPHPGSQRKLRMELEHAHRQGQGATGEMSRMEAVAGASQTNQPAPQPAIPKSEIPGADVINKPTGQPTGQSTGQPTGQPPGPSTESSTGQPIGTTGEQTDEHNDARRSASY